MPFGCGRVAKGINTYHNVSKICVSKNIKKYHNVSKRIKRSCPSASMIVWLAFLARLPLHGFGPGRPGQAGQPIPFKFN